MSTRRRFVLFALLLILGGCATSGARTPAPEDEETWDPFEPFNRAMFTFNEKFDDWLLKPVAKGYDWLLPQPVKNGVGNFFTNLIQPAVAVNNLLQGKPKDAGKDLGRFVVNSTAGVLGFMDIARDIGLEPREEDWGQTFAVWGIGEGPYFVWPIIGSRSLRETFGWGFDWASNPVTYLEPVPGWGATSLDIVNTRARLLPAEKVVDAAAGEDKYIFIREAYRQRRRNLVYDGNPPKQKFFEEELENNNNATPAPAAPKSE
jgi:phospholipid-binding lipoprotein MlaA